MGTMMIAIDPGRTTGVAVFTGVRLAFARSFDCLSKGVVETLGMGIQGARVVYEMPIDRGLDRVNPRDIIELSLRLGLVLGELRAYGATWPFRAVTPHGWKGQLRKDLCHARIAKSLDDREEAIFASVDHNGRDAVGIGLWDAGRFGLGY